MSEKIDKPAHYLAGDVECAEVIQALSTQEQWRHFCAMTAFAYLWRQGRKEGEPAEDDIAKALRWLEIALGRKEADESQHWESKCMEMKKQYDAQCAETKKWKMMAQEWQGEHAKRTSERDEARRFADLRFRELGKALQQRDEARQQVVELTKQLVEAGLSQAREAK